MGSFFSLLGMVLFLIAGLSVLCLFVKKIRKRAFFVFGASFIAGFIFSMIGGTLVGNKAKQAGFASVKKMSSAKERGIPDAVMLDSNGLVFNFTAQDLQKLSESLGIEAIPKGSTPSTTVQAVPVQPELPKEKYNPNLKPAKNMYLITSYLKQTKINWRSAGEDVCISDNYCSIYAANLQIQAIGGRVDILPSASVSTSDYMMMCSVVLSGLSSLTIDQASNYIAQAFEEGSRSGGSKYKIADVDLQIRAGGDSRLLCNYFRLTK